MAFRTRLIVVSTLILLASATLLGVYQIILFQSHTSDDLSHFSKHTYMERETKLQSIVMIACTLSNDYIARWKKGEFTEEEAKQRFLRRLSMLRFDNGQGYYWVHEFKGTNGTPPVIIMHPTSPQVVGRRIDEFIDLRNLKTIRVDGDVKEIDDADVMALGRRFLVQMNERCAERGEGSTTYFWTKPVSAGGTTDEGYKKLAYVKLIPEWNWVVGAGLYLDDIEDLNVDFAEGHKDLLKESVKKYVTFLAVAVAVSILAVIMITSLMTQELQEIASYANGVAHGDYPGSIPITGHGEFKAVRTAFVSMAAAVRAREHDLVEKAHELTELNKRLELANGARSTLLANVSHELRTPLVSIIGYCELMLNGAFGELNKAQKDRLESIIKNGNQLLDVLEELLAVSGLESKQLSDRMRIDLRHVAVEAKTAMLPRAERRGIRIDTVLPDTPVEITVSATKLARALFSVIDNALKFSAKDSKIRIEVVSGEAHAAIVIRDWGIGIPRDKLDKIFDKFYQVDQSKTRRYGGLGLGLSIAKEIIEAEGGTIELESEEGKGSTCRITFPIERG